MDPDLDPKEDFEAWHRRRWRSSVTLIIVPVLVFFTVEVVQGHSFRTGVRSAFPWFLGALLGLAVLEVVLLIRRKRRSRAT